MANFGNVPVPLSAKSAKVRINTNIGGSITQYILPMMSWTVTPETAQLDTSSFESGGFEDQIGGLRKLDVHMEGWYDAANSPYDTPLNLQDGQVILFSLYTNDLGSPCWNGTGLIKGTPMKADVHGRVDISMDMKAKGSFISPTITTTSTTTTT